MQDAGMYGFNNIKRWTASRKCLDKDFVFVPVHGSLHWCATSDPCYTARHVHSIPAPLIVNT